MDEREAEEFDKGFTYKEKLKHVFPVKVHEMFYGLLFLFLYIANHILL